jgi:hypothetical protein
MNNLVDVLATSGFWSCVILFMFRGAIKERILRAPTRQSTELAEMKARLQALEGRIAVMNTEILELREVQDFDRRLAGKPERPVLPVARTATAVTATASAAAAGRLKLPQR